MCSYYKRASELSAAFAAEKGAVAVDVALFLAAFVAVARVYADEKRLGDVRAHVVPDAIALLSAHHPHVARLLCIKCIHPYMQYIHRFSWLNN